MNLNSGCERIIKNCFYLLLCFTFIAGCTSKPAVPEQDASLEGGEDAESYFGLEFPTLIVSRFAPAIFKEELHAPPIFTPDGREVYWSTMGEPRGVLFMKIQDGAWTSPAPAPFDRSNQGDSPFISSDGTHLLYLSWSTAGTEVIRQVDREDDHWGSSRKLPDEINRYGAHWQASMSDNGNLYFGSDGEIFFSKFESGSYTDAELLDLVPNENAGYEGSPFIAPDESFLIFDVAGSSYADLYITFRNDADEWGEPVAMEELNSGGHDLYANVSPDRRFIMFLSSRTGILLPYWVDASVIEDYRTLK